MTSKLRVAIIGGGSIARTAHAPNFLKLQDRVEVAAVAGRDLARTQAFAEEFGVPHAFDSYEEMFRAVELDAVSICTPNNLHAPVAIAALAAGCHVFCEKPPAMNAAEAQAMANAANRAGKHLTYALSNRTSPEAEALKRFIDAGELGFIYAASVRAMRRRGIPGWGVFTNKELQGGGPLIDIGVHMLDLALYLMGYPAPDLVLGHTYQHIGTRPGVGTLGDWDPAAFTVEDLARGMIRFQNGATILLDTSFAANIEKIQDKQVTLMGELGGADLFPLKINQEKHGTLLDITPAWLPKKGHHELLIERFVDAGLGGELHPSLPTAKQGVILQQLLDALYGSAETGEPVRFAR